MSITQKSLSLLCLVALGACNVEVTNGDKDTDQRPNEVEACTSQYIAEYKEMALDISNYYTAAARAAETPSYANQRAEMAALELAHGDCTSFKLVYEGVTCLAKKGKKTVKLGTKKDEILTTHCSEMEALYNATHS